MNFLLHGLHPTFDALSAYADQPDVDAARTRVGRHVSRCAACAGTVGEIRALGDAARAVELPGAPADLWSRIERASIEEAETPPARMTPPPDADPWRTAPALRPTRHVPSPLRRALRIGGMTLAAAAAVLAVLLVPTSRGEQLQAGARSGSWRFTPSHPSPGATVRVRYIPAADESLPSTMLLLAGFARPIGDSLGRRYNGIDRLQDSLATLVRQADGTYAGRFVLPRDFSALVARLTDSSGSTRVRIMTPGGPVSRTYEAIALLVGGDTSGRPALGSLTAALDLWDGSGAVAYLLSDTLMKYYPSEPIGYAAARRPKSRNLLDDLIAWFGSGERQYARLDSRLMEQPRVSVAHATAMIRFANRIDEPGEVRKWTMRLVREHPGDPRTLDQYSSLLAGMLSRSGTLDSIRRDLPLADTLWERNGHRSVDRERELLRVANIVGDTLAHRRWALRSVQSGTLDWRGNRMLPSPAMLRDSEVRRVLGPILREISRAGCVVPSGKFPFDWSSMTWEEGCTSGQAETRQALSIIARLDGEPVRALALADSALVLMQSTGRCWTGGSHVRRGEALLAMGDPRAAAVEMAWGAVNPNWQATAFRDSVGRLLRPAVTQGEWEAAIARATAEQSDCLADWKRRSADRFAR